MSDARINRLDLVSDIDENLNKPESTAESTAKASKPGFETEAELTTSTEKKTMDFIFWTKVTSFGNQVSIGGLRYAVSSGNNAFRRFFWMILVCFGLALAAYQISDRIDYYRSRPTKTKVEIKHQPKLKFPTVTICNENKIRKSAAKEKGLDTILTQIMPPFPSTVFKPNLSLVDDPDTDWGLLYTSLAQPPAEALNHCVWNGQHCTKDIYKMIHTNMGYCLNFNGESRLWATGAGAKNGISLVLFCNQSDYLITNSGSAGFRILLHEPDEPPMMEEAAFKVNPGVYTQVMFSLHVEDLYRPPYSNCRDDIGYSRAQCLQECYQKYLENRCDCREMHLNGTRPVCNPRDIYNCASQTETDFIQDQDTLCVPHCPSQCVTSHYKPVVTFSKFSQVLLDFVVTYLINNTGVSKEYVIENYVLVEIYFSQMSFMKIEMSPAYGLFPLLCDIGGALGLVLGSTVLTMFEVMDFLIALAWDLLPFTRKTSNKIKSAFTI